MQSSFHYQYVRPEIIPVFPVSMFPSGLEASIPLEKALSRSGDVLLAYRMNDQQLPAQHGYPLRVIVPGREPVYLILPPHIYHTRFFKSGHVGIRNVKWLKEIRLSEEEAYGTWQRGMAYKVAC
jgi:DMSO/TMAO reductase YedYZ molybdopterin-dependent catalytic subunit